MERVRYTDRDARRERLLRGLVARDLFDEVAGALDAAGVKCLPLKGVTLHLTGCRSREERGLVDVDVLIGGRHLERALRALRQLGFVPVARTPASVTLCRAGTPLPLDLHHRLFDLGLFDLPTEVVFARAESHEGVLVPSPLDLYAHLVGHWVKGRLAPRDIEHLTDFAAVSTHFGLHANRVATHLQGHGLGRAARYALGSARDRAGDAFAGRVLGYLPRDPLGGWLARGAGALLEALPTEARRGALATHALNVSLPRGAGSLAAHAYQAIRRSVT